MGSGSFSSLAYADYCVDNHRSYDTKNMRTTSTNFFQESKLNESMRPKGVIRECVNSEEHPNTLPVILALDVTGSMGHACLETAQALSKIINTLYERFPDVEVMIMGIGDFEYDQAPLQVGQFESDVRIAADIDRIYREGKGGGNKYESYTAAWYFGLKNTKLDCYDKQGRKGIIITMGDEPLNPILYKDRIEYFIGNHEQADVRTEDLYKEACEKFDIFHIAVDDPNDSYEYHKKGIHDTFGKLLGERLIVSTIKQLSDNICNCVGVAARERANAPAVLEEGTSKPEITW